MASMFESLRQYVSDFQPASIVEQDNNVRARFSDLLSAHRQEEIKLDPTLAAIPRFFSKAPTDQVNLKQMVNKVARISILDQRSLDMLDASEFEQLWNALTVNSPGAADEPEAIDYQAFCRLASRLPPKFQDYFRPSLFMKLHNDANGRVGVLPFFNYVMRKVTYCQTRVRLSLHDVFGKGYLRENDMENFVYDLIPSLPSLQQLDSPFIPYYVVTAVRKFFFFLDPQRKGRIAIKDILNSPILEKLFSLKDDLTEAELKSNWFSATSVVDVYGQYLQLDTDRNGMLSKEEFARFGGQGYTSVFVDRVFQELPTFNGEMDYKMFLDFVLASRFKRTPESMRFFWRFLDIKRQGYLTIFTINYFFREIVKKLSDLGCDPVNVEDVKDEIFDMVKPADPLKITIEDLLSCGCGYIVVDILADVNAFWAYDNRESMIADQSNDDQ